MRQWSSPLLTGDTTEEVIDYYYRYLSRNADLAAHFSKFKRQLKRAPHAAKAEAVVFSLLRAENLAPTVFEDDSHGGPDFRCEYRDKPFLVEVTSLDPKVVTERSGLSSISSNGIGGAFGLLTDRLLSEAKNKATQLGNHALPGVLAITCDHEFGGILLDRHAAQTLMMSAPCINSPFDGGPTFITTDLKHSVFYRASSVLGPDQLPIISACRQSISAILLLTLYSREVSAVGLLHPEAQYPFSPTWLPQVPYITFAGPPTANSIKTQWTFDDCNGRPASFPHRRIR